VLESVTIKNGVRDRAARKSITANKKKLDPAIVKVVWEIFSFVHKTSYGKSGNKKPKHSACLNHF